MGENAGKKNPDQEVLNKKVNPDMSHFEASKKQKKGTSKSEDPSQGKKSTKEPFVEILDQNSCSNESFAGDERKVVSQDEDKEEDLISDGKHGEFNREELKKVLSKLKEEKKSQATVAISSPFIKKVKKSPLPRSYRMFGDLKFDGSSDHMEYISRFNTEMEVYQIKEPTRCRFLAATLIGDAH